MKVAALDLGSNTFLCLICNVKNGKIIQIDSDLAEVVRLGEGLVNSSQFSLNALERAQKCLARFKNEIEKHEVKKILAVATAAARKVNNPNALFDLGHKLGIPIEVISGDLEAELTYQGALSQDQTQEGGGLTRMLIDIGGGSTEIIVGKGGAILFKVSIPVGSVRLSEMFRIKEKMTDSEYQRLSQAVEKAMSPVLETLKTQSFYAEISELVAVAGTPTELARAELGEFIVEKIDGFKLDSAKLKSWIEKFKQLSTEEIHQKLGISLGRADVILAGTQILFEIAQHFQHQVMKVSTRGVRYGVALEIERREYQL